MKRAAVPCSFYLAGGFIILFLLLPLIGTLLDTDPASLRGTLVDADVLASIGLTFSAAAIATGIGLVAGVPLAYLMAADNLRQVEINHRGRIRHVLEYGWPGQRIWGATAAILYNLRRRLEQVQ